MAISDVPSDIWREMGYLSWKETFQPRAVYDLIWSHSFLVQDFVFAYYFPVNSAQLADLFESRVKNFKTREKADFLKLGYIKRTGRTTYKMFLQTPQS